MSPETIQKKLNELSASWNAIKDTDTTPNPTEVPSEPGIYEGIPFDTYLRIDAINASALKSGLKSMHHYRYTPASEPAPHLQFGTLVHEAKLEPDQLHRHYVVRPDDLFLSEVGNDPKTNKPYARPKATSAYKRLVEDWLAQNPGKVEVTADWFDSMEGMLKSLKSNARAARAFKAGDPEVTLIWEDEATSLLCKARVDWIPHAMPALVDLKTCASINEFESNIAYYNYHIQAAHYVAGYQALTGKVMDFAFVAVEKQAPYVCYAAALDLPAIEVGTVQRDFILSQIATCHKTSKWPRPKNPKTFSLPKYYDPNRTAASYGLKQIYPYPN